MNTRQWVTILRAMDPKTKELKTWGGPTVPGLSMKDAQLWCERNGMGYLTVIGELAVEIGEDGSEIDHEAVRSN